MSMSRRGPIKGSRHVSFLSKCQVIPFSDEEDDPISEELAHRAAERDKKTKRRSRLNVFRSLSSSNNSNLWEDLDRDNNNGGSDTRDKNSKRAMSPSLPINKNPGPSQFEQIQMQRRKLVSPPPPAMSPSSNSPLQTRLALAAASAQSQPSFASTSRHTMEQQSIESTLAKPRAIRKPLSLGQSMEDEVDVNDRMEGPEQGGMKGERKQGILHVPAVVNIQRYSPSIEKPPTAAAILNWKDDDDDEGGSEQTATSNSEFREEDLNQECVCANCEAKMVAALDPTYSTPWTRPARKKYLTDLKQAQIEGTKAIPKVPNWLNNDHLEVYSTSSVKEVKADEVDTKRGTSRTATLPSINVSGDSVKEKSKLDDNSTKKDEETKTRKEEQRSPRVETKTLSNDSASGLWIGGGGARAMMRQLEDAERQEKRASIQRTNSNTNEGEKTEVRPMGAVKDTHIQPFTIPRRLSDNSPRSPVIELPRTPSPQKLEPTKKVISPSKKELERERDRDYRHPSPSYLIRRELTLGIPVHSNTNTNLQKPSTTWPSHPPTRTPSPRLISPTTLYDIAEVPSNLSTTSISGGINSGGIGSGISTPRRAHSIGHQAQSKRITVSAPNGDAKVKRSSSMSAHGAGNRKSLDSSTRLGLGVNLSQHANQIGDSNDQGQTRFRHKAKNSISNLVARIKN